MLQLQEELTSTENKVAFARQAFNDAVLSYNNACENFPGNLIAEQLSASSPPNISRSSNPRNAPCRKSRSTERPLRAAVDFFARQEQSRRTSRMLVGAFMLVVHRIVALATTIAAQSRCVSTRRTTRCSSAPRVAGMARRAHRGLVATVGGGTFAVMVLASLYRATSCGRGGGRRRAHAGRDRASRGEGNDPLAAPADQRRRGDGARIGRAGSGDLRTRAGSGHQRLRGRAEHANAAITVTRGALERLDAPSSKASSRTSSATS